MTAQKGKDLLLKVAANDNPSPAFQTIGGLRARSFNLNAASVDITNADSSNAWRELLAGAGVKSASVSGAGVFRDETADATVRQIFFDGIIRQWQIVIPHFGTMEGKFQIASLEYAGEHDGEVSYEIALESAGALTFTAA